MTSFTTNDNSAVDGDRVVAIEGTTENFASGQDSVSILDEDVPPPTLSLQFDRTVLSESDALPTLTLEDLGSQLAPESFDNGADGAGLFDAGLASFNNVFDPTFGSWGGWSLSNTTDSTTAGFTNQYSAVTGGGALGSATYAVASAFPGGTVPTISIDEPQPGQSFESLMVTNSTYAALSMRDGDSFAKKFGGPEGDEADFFMLTIEGFDDSGASVGTVEFFLADFRFEDDSQDYIVEQWTTVDLSGLDGATELAFSLSSSDVGDFGMNTPAYFAVDQVVLKGAGLNPAKATIARIDSDLSSDLEVDLAVDDSTEILIPGSVVIPSGSATVEVEVFALDDAVVDGTQSVLVSASADSHVSASASLDVEDDDQSALTVSVPEQSAIESDGSAAIQLLVHRNVEDTSNPLMVQLSAEDGVQVAMEGTIPSGMSSSLIDVSLVDNRLRDGDRHVVIEVSAEGFNPSTTTLQVIDDETSAIVLTETDGNTSASELYGEDQIEVSLSAQPLSDVVLDIRTDQNSLTVDAFQLRFTPDQWNEPRRITLTGVPDLAVEGDEELLVTVSVDEANSDPLFALSDEASVSVTLQDHLPESLQVSEDDASVFVKDVAADAEIQRGSHAEGIEVVANDLPQTFTVESLERTSGPVSVDAAGGDDSVILRGTRFTMLQGGDGYDRLVLNLAGPGELVDLLSQRVDGFEEIVVSSELQAALTIDLEQLDSLVTSDDVLLVRKEQDQTLSFQGDGSLGQPVLVAEEFAQVVFVNDLRVHVISASPWQNVLDQWDVDNSGDVTSLDALLIVNQLPRSEGSKLPPPTSLSQFTGSYFDVSGDGNLTSIDALRVINEVARRLLAGEGEPTLFFDAVDQDSEGAFAQRQLPDLNSLAPASRKLTLVSTNHDEAIRQLFVVGASEASERVEQDLPLSERPSQDVPASGWAS